MPPTTGDPKPSFHVLVTGFGTFSKVNSNPSWRAVAPLHNTVIHTASATIHVTAIGPLKVTYSPILSLVPGLHARPPRLPSPDDTDAPMPEPRIEPPPEGYDLTFHLGAGRNGALSLEQVGHRTGYRGAGVEGELAPIVATDAHLKEQSAAERFEAERLRLGKDSKSDSEASNTTSANGSADTQVVRGFAEGYECFPEELRTEVDVPGVMEHLKQQGESRVVASTDAGHYMCDFICYGSLAESQRPLYDPAYKGKETKRSKSLFMHVPYDEYQPHSIQEMTDAVRQIIAWVCTKEAALA